MKLFLPSHYAAFEEPKPSLDEPVVRAERLAVREALMQLHGGFPFLIQRSKWGLHPGLMARKNWVYRK